MAFLIDAGWVEVIVGALALILSLVIYRLSRKKKSLSYEVLSESPLISISDEIKDSLQVLFNGKPVENIHLLLVKFVNDGNVPVAANDYERPLTLRFKDASTVIFADKIQVTPDNLTPSINISDQNVIVEPIMLNASDSFTIKVLISQYSGKFAVDARVLGIKSIQTPPKSDRKIKITLAAVSAAALVMLAVIGSAVLGQLSQAKRLLSSGPPHISKINAQGVFLKPGGGTLVTSTISNITRGLKYQWSALRGKVSNTNVDQTIIYNAPDVPGRDIVTLTITDDIGRTDTESIFVTISLDAPPPNQTNQMP
jgi:hypothetical protein